MRALLLSLTVFLASCSPSEDEVAKLQPNKPDLNWQKGGDSVLRGDYTVQEPIQKSEFKQIGEALCFRSPKFDPRVRKGSEAVSYTEYWTAGGGEAARMLIRDTAIGFDGRLLNKNMQVWAVADKQLAYLEAKSDLLKENYYGDGRYFTLYTYNEMKRGIAVFPAIERSPFFEEIVASLPSRSDSGNEYNIGHFKFGNGETTKAASSLMWVRNSSGAVTFLVSVLIPLASSLNDMSCVPERAYEAYGQINSAGVLTFKYESEVLYTNVQ